MSDKNIDKDIELLKEMKANCIKASNGKGTYFDAKAEQKAQAIENVLSELENLQDDLRIHEETSFDFQKENIELREEIKERHIKHIALAIENEDLEKELETYKKIAEKLVDKILEMDIDGEVYDFFCKYIPMEKCDEFSDGYCDKCIIDWARNEVENEKE